MDPVDAAVLALDAATAARVRPALAWLRARTRSFPPEPSLLQEFLVSELPRRRPGDGPEQHEVAWALGDLFEQAGLEALARTCRSSATHESLAVWRWTRSFAEVPTAFWEPAVTALATTVEVPPRAALSMSSARALLATVGAGLTLTTDGQLPPATVHALDDRFGWTEEFPWMRAEEERDVAPLRLLHEHLVAQRLLVRDGHRLTRTAAGVHCTDSTASLWRALVDPFPRWSHPFQRDALGVMVASVLRSSDFALGRIGEEMTHVLAGKWRPSPTSRRGTMFDGASQVAQEWYQVGVPLGWWDTGRGPADRRPNTFGRSAAVAVFRAVAARRGASSVTR
jgi:hypothetical protein